LEVHVDAQELRVIGKDEPEKDRAEVQKTMLGPEVLDGERPQEIVFKSTAAEPAGPGRWTLHGNLTLRGQARPVTVLKPSFLNLLMKKLARLSSAGHHPPTSRSRVCYATEVISFEVCVFLGSDLFGPVGPAYGNQRNNVLLVSVRSFVDGFGATAKFHGL
jgi:YceI-like domain